MKNVKNPTELQSCLPLHRAPEHRYYTCKHYSACLLYAAKSLWRSFSCCQCPIMREQTFSCRKAVNE